MDEILDFVRSVADDIERSRRLPDGVVAALRNTGINRQLIPAALGGIEAPIVDVMDVIERIAAVDGSAGWCAAIGAGPTSSPLPARNGPRNGLRRSGPGNATMFAVVGRVVSDHGRTMLTGCWPFTSNCLHSACAGLGALFSGADGVDPVPRAVSVPMSDLRIEDSWDVVGLRGTGSHHVVAKWGSSRSRTVRQFHGPALAGDLDFNRGQRTFRTTALAAASSRKSLAACAHSGSFVRAELTTSMV